MSDAPVADSGATGADPPWPRGAVWAVWAVWGLVAFALVVAGAVWAWQRAGMPAVLWSGDAYQFAILARRLSEGEGFTTGVLFPAQLSFGVGVDHPSLVRPPAWPLLIAGGFLVTGPSMATVLALAGLCFVGATVFAALLAGERAGVWIGGLTTLAVATQPHLTLYLHDGVSELPFALCVTAFFWLCTRRASPLAIGAVIGAAYLVRYNGILLLGIALPWLLLGERRLRPLVLCGLGFVAVATPWWIRNTLVAGSPFYSLYDLAPWVAPAAAPGFSMNYSLDPAPAMDPWKKFTRELPGLLRHWPLASANLAACVGVALGCWRRDAASLAVAAAAAAMTLVAALVVPNGRYFAPFLPAWIAIGAAGLWRFAGPLRIPLLAALLAAPLLPGPPPKADVKLLLSGFAAAREAAGTRPAPEPGQRWAPLRDCLRGRPLVLAQHADPLVWHADVRAIKMPGRREDFWRIVDEYPVQFVQMREFRHVPAGHLRSRFRQRADCGGELYERRPERPR